MRSTRSPAFGPYEAPSRRVVLLLGLLGGVAAAQLLPHPAGVSPVAAMALFAGACFHSRGAALLVSLGGFALAGLAIGLVSGDWERGFHALAPAVYGSWALSVALGWWLRSRRSAAHIAAASVAGSLLFFAITNYAVWATYETYPHTLAGLAACYLAGLPFLARGLVGDLAYAGALFGALAWVEQRAPSLRVRAAAGSA